MCTIRIWQLYGLNQIPNNMTSKWIIYVDAQFLRSFKISKHKFGHLMNWNIVFLKIIFSVEQVPG